VRRVTVIKIYVKKPVEIEAVQFDGSRESAFEIKRFTKDCRIMTGADVRLSCGLLTAPIDENIDICRWDGRLIIPTLEGVHVANIGDYIIKGIKGEFYPCKPDIFAQTYDEVKPLNNMCSRG
jgi:hypothetical protein